MDPQNEAAALGEVQERLADPFPRLGVEVVEAAVRPAYSQLRGPIRDYVPVLVNTRHGTVSGK